MIEVERPKIYSDFDGTAVKKFSKTNYHNWTKSGLPTLDGYFDFLRGAQSEGAVLAGIVSRRSARWRSGVTARSIAEHGFDKIFPNPAQIHLAGSEKAKARIVACEVLGTTVALIDDQPHRVGPALLEVLLEEVPPERSDTHVVLGVVPHPKSAKNVERFMEEVYEGRSETGVVVSSSMEEHKYYLHGPNSSFSLTVVPLRAYTENEGAFFTRQLQYPDII